MIIWSCDKVDFAFELIVTLGIRIGIQLWKMIDQVLVHWKSLVYIECLVNLEIWELNPNFWKYDHLLATKSYIPFTISFFLCFSLYFTGKYHRILLCMSVIICLAIIWKKLEFLEKTRKVKKKMYHEIKNLEDRFVSGWM